MFRKCIFIFGLFLSLSVAAESAPPIFDNIRADRTLKSSEQLLSDDKVSIKKLTHFRDQLEDKIEQAQACIDRQKSKYKKLESTLKIITIPSAETEEPAQTADLTYLKDKQQLVRTRLGTCSLYQLKSKDVLDQLNKAIITQTKHQTWQKSDSLMNAVTSPIKAVNELTFNAKVNTFFYLGLAKYIGGLLIGLAIIFLLVRTKQVVLFIEQLQLKLGFIQGGAIVALTLLGVDSFVTHYLSIDFETSTSALFFDWVYLSFLYLVTLVYGACFLKVHEGFRLKKIGFVLLLILISAFLMTFGIALYGYPYLAYYISTGILETLEISMVTLILMVISSKLSNNLNTLLSHTEESNETEAVVPTETEIEFKVLSLSLKAGMLVYWLTLCINTWQLSLSADRVLLKWVYEGFYFLNIMIVPVDFVKAGLVFALITIVIRVFSKTMFKSINPILLNFSYLIAGLAGLFVAGVNLTGIAVVAGALSVGIGMGLKGIVNNFISGLILLIEKPIKRGDRIIVDGVEGYVKNIGLRATEIQTPTNTDVIVPNEQFITSTVTNYMLNSTSSISGLEVGIAYGADVEKAQEILLEMAKNHPHIISNVKTMPWVCLKTFADSAIILKLIYTIKHAKYLYRTKSELNNTIYKKFKEHNIEFPFPQSDVYIKEFPTRGESSPAPDKD